MRATPSKRPRTRTWRTPDLRAARWAAWKKGLTLKQVASVIGINWESVASELGRRSGIAPLHRRNPHTLTADEREETSRGVARKLSVRADLLAFDELPNGESNVTFFERNDSSYQAKRRR